MDGPALRELQAPLKARYSDEPEAARITLRAEGLLGEGVSCKLETGHAIAEAGLHPATGGDGRGIDVEGQVQAEGEVDFRGTLGVDREAAVGFERIRLTFELESDADAEQVDTLLRLTERTLPRATGRGG